LMHSIDFKVFGDGGERLASYIKSDRNQTQRRFPC
jgi:hypothetical protein